MTSKYYYKERLQNEAHKKYQNLSVEEKDKRQKRSDKDIKIFLKNKRRKLLEYMKNYYLAHKKVIV